MHSIIHKFRKQKNKKVLYFDTVVLLVLMLVTFFFLYNKFTKKSIWINTRVLISNNEWWWSGESPKYWLVDGINPGLESYNSFGEKVAEIIDTEIFSLGGPNKQAFIDLKLKVSYDKKRQIYLYNFQPIQKGKPVDITFGSYNINGLVTSLNSEPEERFIKKIKVKTQYLDDWMANSYKAGMIMKDSNGRLLAEINSVKVQNSNVSGVRLINNGFYYGGDQLKDAIMDITISTLQDNDGSFRFVDGSSIKIGDDIWFQFKDINAKVKIMKIIE